MCECVHSSPAPAVNLYEKKEKKNDVRRGSVSTLFNRLNLT